MLVNSLEHLKELANNKNGDFQEFYLKIANGLAKSSKRILYHKDFDEFSLIHEIDESYQEFSSETIGLKTNLLLAIKSKTLFKS